MILGYFDFKIETKRHLEKDYGTKREG